MGKPPRINEALIIPIKCFYCGEIRPSDANADSIGRVGKHIEKGAPKHVWKPRIIAKSPVVTNPINSKEEKCYCDCGCSQHIINNKNALIDLYYINMDRVIPDNGAKGDVLAI